MTRFNSTEIIGVNAIENIFITQLNWIFRSQPLVDVGIDAMIEAVVNDVPTGKFIGAQIKSGKSNFHSTEKSWTYYASDIHYNYWTNCNIPVILIGYILEQETAYWIHLIPENFIRTKRRWKIDIPKKQKLNSFSGNRLLKLVDLEIKKPIDQKWSIERTNLLTKRAAKINESVKQINALNEHLSLLHSSQQEANKKFKTLIKDGRSLDDYQTRSVIDELVESFRTYTPLMEADINQFSKLYAEGVGAFKELIQGCKELNLHQILKDTLPLITPLPDTVEKTSGQIDKLRETVDRFSKKDRDLKNSTIILSEVLSLILREFSVAKTLTQNIIDIIEE